MKLPITSLHALRPRNNSARSSQSIPKPCIRRIRAGWLLVAALALFATSGDAGAGLVGLWQCDEGTGQVVADSSGNGLNGYLGTSAADIDQDATWSASGSTLPSGGGSCL